MEKYSFSSAQRFAIWQTHESKCFWCGEPIRFKDVTVDHIFPESLNEKPGELERLKVLYSLRADFQINDYGNWVPCHHRCNCEKGSRAFSPSPAILMILDGVERKAAVAARIERRVLGQKSADALLAKLIAMVEAERIAKSEILDLFSDRHEEEVQLLQRVGGTKHVSDQWRVTSVFGEIATVTDGALIGRTSVGKDPHHSWQCPFCESFGPWSGIMCLECGRRSDE